MLKLDPTSNNGLLSGLVVMIVFEAAETIGSTAVWVLLWSFMAVMSAAFAVVTWRRTRMLWMTAQGTVTATAAGVVGAFYAAGWTLADIGRQWPSAYFTTLAALPALHLLSQWREAGRWRAWRQRTEHVRFGEMFRFRHIPDLRSNGV